MTQLIPYENRPVLQSGQYVEHIDPATGLTRVQQFTISTGEIVPAGHFLVSNLDLAKAQDLLAGEGAADRSYVLGWWDHRYWRIEDGVPVSRRQRKSLAVAEPQAKRSKDV